LRVPFFRPSWASRRWFARPFGMFLVILAAVAWGSIMAAPAAASPALAQHTSKDAGITVSSSLAFPLNNTAGNWIGVVIRAGHSGQIFAVSDSQRNIYRQALQFNQTLDTPNGRNRCHLLRGEYCGRGKHGDGVRVGLQQYDALRDPRVFRFGGIEFPGCGCRGPRHGTALNSGTAATTIGGDLV